MILMGIGSQHRNIMRGWKGCSYNGVGQDCYVTQEVGGLYLYSRGGNFEWIAKMDAIYTQFKAVGRR